MKQQASPVVNWSGNLIIFQLPVQTPEISQSIGEVIMI